MSLQSDYLERVYSGFLGKNVGIRLGAPVEPAIWTFQRIREVYGDIRGYIKPYRNFAADDDANGPAYFIRALLDDAIDRPLEARDVERAWLEYAREGIGMFWWGGYGRSTEHTAYLNLKSGIHAPESGSAERNGRTVAEQIGGQIFIDTWGLVWPGRPDKAAEYAGIAASVSHDGAGVHGARFIAACIAAAFKAGSVREVMDAGLAQIPADSLYAQVVQAVLDFHAAHADDFRACQDYLIASWGYDRYPGLCHMIPNAGVCALALAYGGGDFSRTVEIATMCGWDTDCNAGNVGTILGVLRGLEGIPDHYRAPINDGIVLSGISGALNIMDLPGFSRLLALLGYRLSGEKPPAFLEGAESEEGLRFDFSLPGSTHNLRLSDPVNFALVHRPGQGEDGGGALEVRFDRLEREASGRVFYKPFYRRADFDDERYSPTFAPTVRPGHRVRIHFRLERWEGEKLGVEPYVRETSSGRIVSAAPIIFPEPGRWYWTEFEVPDLGGSQADEIGLIVTGYSGAKKRDSGRLFIDRFLVDGKARYTIDIAKQALEFACVTPFSHDGGYWTLEGGRMHLMTHNEAASYTGGHGVRDQRVNAVVRPLSGASHLVLARAKGAMRGYCAGFDGAGRVSIIKKDFGVERLASANFAWELGRDYTLSLEARGQELSLSVDGVPVLRARDAAHSAGMVGCAAIAAARALYGPFEIEEY